MIFPRFTYTTKQKNHKELPYKRRMPVIFKEDIWKCSSTPSPRTHPLSLEELLSWVSLKFHLNYSYVLTCNLVGHKVYVTVAQSSTKTLLARFVMVPRGTILLRFLFYHTNAYQGLTHPAFYFKCVYIRSFFFFFHFSIWKILLGPEITLSGLAQWHDLQNRWSQGLHPTHV